MTTPTLFVVFSLLVTTPADTDKDKLKGTWSVTAFTADGADVAETTEYRLVVEDGKYKWNAGAASENGTFVLDSKKTPKTITLKIVEGADEGKEQPGIYELSQDKLKICLAPAGVEERPKKFESKPGSGMLLLTLEREKKEDK